MSDQLHDDVRAALAAAEDDRAHPAERAEMLMEIALPAGQLRPKTPAELHAAIDLDERAARLCPAEEPLLAARIGARRASALHALPEGGPTALEETPRAAYEQALGVLATLGSPEELAEVEMNLGLVLQQLAGERRVPITHAISAYQRALRTFDRARFPREFAILQNNLATAFLAIPFTDERARLREALAVQAFEDGLRVVNLIDHPTEWAMLQNNLGNALQYASSSHVVENNLRALEAYDEALKVRSPRDHALEYANTLANKANCLWNLDQLREARASYAEARELFSRHGENDKARLVGEAFSQIERELLAAAEAP